MFATTAETFIDPRYDNNLFLRIKDTTLSNMRMRNTRTGYLSMIDSALYPFKHLPQVAAILSEQKRVYEQDEMYASVDQLRQMLIALRDDPTTREIKINNTSLINMVNFSLIELDTGWPQQNVRTNNNANNNNANANPANTRRRREAQVQLPQNFGLTRLDIQMAKFGPFVGAALVLCGFVPKDIPHRNAVITVLLIAALAGMAYSIHRFWRQPAQNNNQQNRQPPQDNPPTHFAPGFLARK